MMAAAATCAPRWTWTSYDRYRNTDMASDDWKWYSTMDVEYDAQGRVVKSLTETADIISGTLWEYDQEGNPVCATTIGGKSETPVRRTCWVYSEGFSGVAKESYTENYNESTGEWDNRTTATRLDLEKDEYGRISHSISYIMTSAGVLKSYEASWTYAGTSASEGPSEVKVTNYFPSSAYDEKGQTTVYSDLVWENYDAQSYYFDPTHLLYPGLTEYFLLKSARTTTDDEVTLYTFSYSDRLTIRKMFSTDGTLKEVWERLTYADDSSASKEFIAQYADGETVMERVSLTAPRLHGETFPPMQFVATRTGASGKNMLSVYTCSDVAIDESKNVVSEEIVMNCTDLPVELTSVKNSLEELMMVDPDVSSLNFMGRDKLVYGDYVYLDDELSVETLETATPRNETEEAEWFTPEGRRTAGGVPGLYIVRRGNSVNKIVVR